MQTVKSIWDFFQTELLGMSWLNRLIGDLLNACGLDTAGKVGGSVQFFIYDTIKIMVLLGVLILIISYIQSYFPPERTKKILGRFHGVGANCIAALLGTVTPFCSCSSIPLFIGFTSAGLPLGVTFSFLISSPMVDLGSLVLLMSIFGWKVAVLYVVLGLVIAVVGGTLIEKLHLENYVEGFIRNANTLDVPQEELHFKDRIKYAWEQVLATAKKVGVSNIAVPWDTLILSVVLFVVIPLAGGMLTRSLIVKRKGKDYFENVFIHKFDSITTIGLLLTLVMIFSFQGNVILENPLHIVLIAIPLILQTFLIFAIAYVACRVLKLPYKIAAPAGMIGASNFFELAVAVAIALFGTTSPAALATTVGVLTEVPVMLLLVRIANKTKGRFPA